MTTLRLLWALARAGVRTKAIQYREHVSWQEAQRIDEQRLRERP